MFSFHFRAMNTEIELSLEVLNEDEPNLREQVMKWFEIVELRFSRFLDQSELTRLNKQSGKRCIVSEPMLQVLLLAEDYREQTEGLFNIFIYDAIHQAGYSHSFELLTGAVTAYSLDSDRSWDCRLQIDSIMKSIQIVKGQKMDLGGIVKSWTVRQLAVWLQEEWEIKRGLINAGGDLVVWGNASENQPWMIGIADPREPQNIDDNIVVCVSDGAAATSSTLRRCWQTDRGMKHHLIDPRSMASSVSDVVQCTVVGADLIACEIWAKVICIAGVEEGVRLLRRKTRHLEALFFTEDKNIHFYGNQPSLSTRWSQLRVDHIYEPNE